MKKRMLQILDEMNLDDVENNTRLIAVSKTLVSVDKVKQGTLITMGADDACLNDLISGEVIPVLIMVNKEAFFKREKVETSDKTDVELSLPINEILRLDDPWPLVEVIKKLVEAADVLLHQKNYDRMGWEEHEHCFREGKKIIALLGGKQVNLN